MPKLTGVANRFNGAKQTLQAFADWIIDNRKSYFETAPVNDKVAIIQNGKDVILGFAYWLYREVLHPMFHDVPENVNIDNPADGNGNNT